MKGNYIDGFVFTVPKNKVAAYKKMATMGRDAWMKFGALDYYECMGDDLKIKPMPGMPKQRSFVETTNAKSGETVWFSFIVFKDRKHRDAVNKKVMKYFADTFTDSKDFDMPNDPSKMAYGGFKAVVKS